MIETRSTPARAGRLAPFAADLARMARRDRGLYAVAALAQIGSLAVQPFTGVQPDWWLVARLSARMGLTGAVVAVLLLAWRLAWLALVARSTTPTRDLGRWLAAFFTGQGLAANVLHTLSVFFIFATGFAVLKGAIAVVAPFSWDAAFAEADRMLHFGRPPHTWLEPLLRHPGAVFAVNILYNLWFFIVTGAFLACAIALRRQALRRQYMMSFMLTWLVGGFVVAMVFSSAGPAYYARIGLGDLYAPLMQALAAASEDFPIWALNTQDILWAGFTGERPGTAGISAFPSMHVATATLFVLAARRIDTRLYRIACGFWVVIMAGSVLLGWHYAVDGYAAALIALACWRVAGIYGRRGVGLDRLPSGA